MIRDIYQPALAEISLSAVYDALSDPVRRLVIARLAEHHELNCSCFLDYGSKTALSYHLARLREAGITQTRVEGKLRHISLREADLEARFPGLLKAVIASALEEARSLEENKPLQVELPRAAVSASKKSAKKVVAKKTGAKKVVVARAPALRKPRQSSLAG